MNKITDMLSGNKHSIIMRLIASVFVLTFALKVYARDFTYTYEGQTLTYTVLDENAKTCQTKNSSWPQHGNSVSGDLIIPEIAKDGNKGYSVTTIGEYGFYGDSGLTSVIIPNTVTSIGEYAFYRCNGLATVTIPNSVTTIGEGAFAYSGIEEMRTATYSLPENIGLKDNVLITLLPDGDNRFGGISSNNLQSYKKVRACLDNKMYGLVKGSDKLSYTNSVYQECDIALVALDQPSQVRCSDNKVVVLFKGQDITADVLSKEGFEFHPSLLQKENIFEVYGGATGEKLTMDVSLKSPGTLFNEIGQHNIDKVEILSVSGQLNGTDVMTINKMSALRILDLSSAHIVEGGTTYREDLLTKTDIVGTQFFYNTSIESIKLPQSAKEIADDAFVNLRTLKGITIGNNISKIGKGAFSGCKLLQNINIPSSVNTIGANAFTNCSSLTTLNIEDGNTDLSLADLSFQNSPLKEVYWGRMLKYTSAKKPFEGCTSLSSVTIGENITSIAESEFKGCLNLKKVNGGSRVSTIGKEAFMNCSSLESISISKQLTIIEASVFNGCSSLTDIELPDNITSIGSQAFWNTALTEIRIPEKVRFIGGYAFWGCGELNRVYSYNLTPPEISSTTFDPETKKSADLKVMDDALVYYWLDPVWQEFLNMSGNLLYMNEIADMTYGDPELDLSQYVVGNEDVTFMTTTPEVISIDGYVATISGAGNAEIWVVPANSDSGKESYRRRFRIEKKNLKMKTRDYLIFEGQAFRFPEHVICEGLAYDDKAEDIEKLPILTCKCGEYPRAGVYETEWSGGRDKNYTFNFENGILIVAGPETSVEFSSTSPFYNTEHTAVEGVINITLDDATKSNKQVSMYNRNCLDSYIMFNCGDSMKEGVITSTSYSEYLISYNCRWKINECLAAEGEYDYRILFFPDANREREYEFNGSVFKIADSDLFPGNVLLESVEVYKQAYSVRNKCVRDYLREKYPISGETGNIIPVCCYINNIFGYNYGQVEFMDNDNSNYYYSVLGPKGFPYFYIDRKVTGSVDFTEIVDILKSKSTKRNFFKTAIEAITQDDLNGTVNIEFTITPAASVNEIPVNVVLILTQDNIHSTNPAYDMATNYNQFKSYKIPEDMQPFVEEYSIFNSKIPASYLTYNEVVRFILPAKDTIASDWTAKVPVKGTFSFKLPDNPLYNDGTMDPENLNFIIVATDASGECVSCNILNWGEYLNGSCSIHLSLDKESLSLIEGQSETLTPVIERDEDVEILSDSWVSSDPSVAVVENGVVTAISKGNAKISYKLTDSLGHEHIATCLLSVTETVGLDYVTTEENSEIQVFTTEGILIKSDLKDLAPGIYIVRCGSSVRKIKII